MDKMNGINTRAGTMAVDRKKKLHKVDKTILALFWTLAEGNDGQRVKAAEELLKRLSNSKTKKDDIPGELGYCLQRLVRGLASNRKYARVGYAAALAKVLRELPEAKVENVLSLITEQLKISHHDSKSEVGSKLLGKVFAYGALLQSGRLLESKHLGTVVRELHLLADKKSYIRPTCTQCLLDIIKQASQETFTVSVWPHLEVELSKGWETCTCDRLLLLLSCLQRNEFHSHLNKSFLKEHWDSSRVVGKKTYSHLLNLLQKCIEMPQLVPFLLESLVAELMRKKGDFVEFWTKVGNPLMVSTLPRKQLALSLCCVLLKNAKTLQQVHNLLYLEVMQVICLTADHKDSVLAGQCNKVESLLLEWCSHEEDANEVLQIVKHFLEIAFHRNTTTFVHSQTFCTIINFLKGESVNELAQVCMDAVYGRDTWALGSESTGSKEKLSQHLVSLLRLAAVNPSTLQSELPCHILKFLFLHAFFRVIKPSKTLAHCQEVSPESSPFIRGLCQTTFYRILSQLLSMRPERQNKQEQVLHYIQVLSDLAHYAEELLSSSDFVHPVKEISEVVREEWKTVMNVIGANKSQKRKSAKSPKLGEKETFNLLILHLAFDLYVDPESAAELLSDVYVCQQKATEKRKDATGGDGEPEWVEVITEVLLSLLSRASKLARKTTVAVFQALSSHLTPTAVGLITQVLKTSDTRQGSEEDLFEFEEVNNKTDVKTDDASERLDNQEDDDDDDDDEMVSLADSSDEEEDEEEQGKVDEELQKSVKAALGSAAVHSDEEDDGDSDVSDSEMFKHDGQLAAAFRSLKRTTKKEKKEKRLAVTNFRLRALDLVEVVVKGERCGDLAIEILEPILNLIVGKFKTQMGKGQQSSEEHLCHRATEIFHFLCKQRNLVDSIHSNKEMMETTRSLLHLAQAVSNPLLAAEVANGCLLIMRLMTHLPNSESSSSSAAQDLSNATSRTDSQHAQQEFVQAIQEVLEEELVHKRNPKYNIAFFASMIKKYPTVFWPLTSSLIKTLQSATAKVHTKTQACTLLSLLLKLNKRDSITDEQWSSFLQLACPAIKELLLGQQKEGLKTGFMLELLTLLYIAVQRATEVERKELAPQDVQLHLAQIKGTFNKEARKMHNKLMSVLTNLQQKKKQTKKRKQEEASSE